MHIYIDQSRHNDGCQVWQDGDGAGARAWVGAGAGSHESRDQTDAGPVPYPRILILNLGAVSPNTNLMHMPFVALNPHP